MQKPHIEIKKEDKKRLYKASAFCRNVAGQAVLAAGFVGFLMQQTRMPFLTSLPVAGAVAFLILYFTNKK